MVLSRLFGRKSHDDAAHQLYLTAAGQARQPVFYRAGGAPDTLDGRFDLLTLHVFLLLRRLSASPSGKPQAELAQSLFDVMFGDMDRNLREMGVGDLTVGKRIREMSEAFYGRVEAYETGILADDDNASLIAGLVRNLYRGNPPPPLVLGRMADYMREAVALLQSTPDENFPQGKAAFPPPPVFE